MRWKDTDILHVDCWILPLAEFFKWMRSFLFCLYICRYMIYYKDYYAFWWSFWWAMTYIHTVGKTYMTVILGSREKLIWLLFFYSVLHVYIHVDIEQIVLLCLGSTVKHSYNDDAYNKIKLTAKPVSSISLIVKLYLELIW